MFLITAWTPPSGTPDYFWVDAVPRVGEIVTQTISASDVSRPVTDVKFHSTAAELSQPVDGAWTAEPGLGNATVPDAPALVISIYLGAVI